MSAKQQKGNLDQLLAAALALPIVAVPVTAQADDARLPPGAVIGSRVLSYRETGDRMKVLEPVLWLKTPIGERWEFSASATIDIVSGASAITVTNVSGRPAQVYTGASITDRRKANDAGLKYKFGELNEHALAATYATSFEKDYDSKAYGLNATFDFNERNTTLALGYGGSDDIVRSVTDRTLVRDRRSRELLMGFTQLLDRSTLVQSNLTITRQSGYLNDPYRLTISLFPGGGGTLAKDTRPDTRRIIAWLTRAKRANGANGFLSGEYRYARDDWGVRSHTLALSWQKPFGELWAIEPGLRYYTQRAADFYRPEILAAPVPRHTSSDQRLASFGALEPSLKLILKLNAETTVDLSYAYYRQQGNWRLGGGGTASFAPLSANLIGAGLVYRF